MRQQLERSNLTKQGFVQQLKQNEEQLRTEQSRLGKIRRDLYSIAEEKRTLETQAEPEPTDVAALVTAFFRIRS